MLINMKTKKIIALVLAVFLIGTIVAACGEPDFDEEDWEEDFEFENDFEDDIDDDFDDDVNDDFNDDFEF